MSDIVCIGAHPDDVEIGMGATVACLADAGHEVTILDLTNGEPTPFGSPERRAVESRAAAAVLGAGRVTLDMPNRYLFDSVEARTALAEVLRDLRPDILFIPYAQDAHPDHVAASAIAMAARFYAKFTKTEMSGEPHYPRRVYRYMAVHMRLLRQPSYIVDTSEHVDRKLEALRCYGSQFGEHTHNAGLLGTIESVGVTWGSMIGTAAGEPFFSDEPIGVPSPDVLL